MVSESNTITIYVNGEPHKLVASTNLLELLTHLALSGKRVALELNHEIVSRSNFANTFLKDNDRVEIVHAIGGG